MIFLLIPQYLIVLLRQMVPPGIRNEQIILPKSVDMIMALLKQVPKNSKTQNYLTGENIIAAIIVQLLGIGGIHWIG